MYYGLYYGPDIIKLIKLPKKEEDSVLIFILQRKNLRYEEINVSNVMRAGIERVKPQVLAVITSMCMLSTTTLVF